MELMKAAECAQSRLKVNEESFFTELNGEPVRELKRRARNTQTDTLSGALEYLNNLAVKRGLDIRYKAVRDEGRGVQLLQLPEITLVYSLAGDYLGTEAARK